MAQIKVDKRIDALVEDLDRELAKKDDQMFDERLIQLITAYAQLVMQKSGEVAKEFSFASKDELRKIALRIKKLYNTPGELIATVATSSLSVIGGFAGCYAVNGSETAKALGQSLPAMGQGGQGFASIPKNKVEAEKEYERFMKETIRMKCDQEVDQGRKDEQKVQATQERIKEADRMRHDTISQVVRTS